MGNGRVRTDDTVGDEGFPGCLCGAVGGYDMFCRSPPRHLCGIPTNERIVRLACAANGRGAFEGMAGVNDGGGGGGEIRGIAKTLSNKNEDYFRFTVYFFLVGG